MAGGRPRAFNPFTCPNCDAYYQVVKVEAEPETDNREIVCRACGGPLTAREGKFVLKYFLLRKGIRSQRTAWAASVGGLVLLLGISGRRLRSFKYASLIKIFTRPDAKPFEQLLILGDRQHPRRQFAQLRSIRHWTASQLRTNARHCVFVAART
jgi:hypothetical protein